MKALLSESRKSQQASKPEKTTHFIPKEQPLNMKMKVYSNNKGSKKT